MSRPVRKRAVRSKWKTAVGIVITAVMLFPLYWMVNVSLTPTDKLREPDPQLFPFDFTGYLATWNWVARLLILITILASAIGVVAESFKFARHFMSAQARGEA